MDQSIETITREGKGDPRFFAILREMWELHCRKGADYGTNKDVFANIKASEEFGIASYTGCAIRMNDKMSRLKAFAINGNLKNESLRDTFIDLACYGAIGVVLVDEAGQHPAG